MNKASITYTLKYRFKNHPHIQITDCKKVFNMLTGRQIKKVLNNRSMGFWINGKFKSLNTLRKQLEIIPKQETPF